MVVLGSSAGGMTSWASSDWTTGWGLPVATAFPPPGSPWPSACAVPTGAMSWANSGGVSAGVAASAYSAFGGNPWAAAAGLAGWQWTAGASIPISRVDAPLLPAPLHTSSKSTRPVYFVDSKPPGFKIFVGDLPRDTSQNDTQQRVWNTLDAYGMKYLFADIRACVTSVARAGSGSSYCVITVGDIHNALVTQSTSHFLFAIMMWHDKTKCSKIGSCLGQVRVNCRSMLECGVPGHPNMFGSTFHQECLKHGSSQAIYEAIFSSWQDYVYLDSEWVLRKSSMAWLMPGGGGAGGQWGSRGSPRARTSST